jgi:E3 ubiquitin-protein ligase HECTD2
MPTWNIFGSTKKASSSHNRNPFGTLHRSYSADSLVTVSTDGTSKTSQNLQHLTTESSAKDIFKSVSAANAAISANTSTDLLSVHHEQQELLLKRRHTTAKKMVVCSCICCGTNLKVPSNAPYYKCRVCDTIHDSSKKDTFIPIPLTLRKVEEALNLDMASLTSSINLPSSNENNNNSIDAYPHLASLIRNAFSCMDALNGSFPLGLTRMSYSKPGIDYKQVSQFYDLINGLPAKQALNRLILISVLGLLKCPRKKLNLPSDVYFLLIVLENPVLYEPETITNGDSSLAYQVFERSIALFSHTPKRTMQYLLNWVSRFPRDQIKLKVLQMNCYIADRLTRCANRSLVNNATDFPLIDFFPTAGGSGGVGVGTNPKRHKKHSASVSTPTRAKVSQYGSDWRLLAFCNILAVFFNANGISQKLPISLFYNQGINHVDLRSDFDAWERLGVPMSSLVPPCISVHSNSVYNNGNTSNSNGGQTNSLHGMNSFGAGSLKLDDETGSWEHTPEFALCKYPFLLELHYKRNLLEYDARRQMEYQVQEAFFNALLPTSNANSSNPTGGASSASGNAVSGSGTLTGANKNNQPYLYIKVRRGNLLQDSFNSLESQETELKKRLRVEFVGEPGVDAGGLKKEWFLLLVRELFDPAQDLFKAPAITTDDGETGNTSINDDNNDDARYHWFATESKQPLRYYQLAGVILGLAIYNSINLDVDLPPVMYRRLLGYSYRLEDFKEVWPQYGNSLQKILDFDGTDEEFLNAFYGLNFTVSKWVPVSPDSVIPSGSSPQAYRVVEEPIIFNGQHKLVTKTNRSDFVRKVVQYYLEDSVKRQFEPLRQGFFKVAGSHALTLFRPQEIEQLIRGNLLEDINVRELKMITKYKNWGVHPSFASLNPAVGTGPPRPPGASTAFSQKPLPQVVEWFWQIFECEMSATQRQQLLIFVTGSDRIPATGVRGMVFKITCLDGGADSERLPIAHTCFNELCLYNYSSRNKLFQKLLVAITESQGFELR